MSKLLIKSGVIESSFDITGSNLLHFLKNMFPNGISDPVISIEGEVIDPLDFDLNRELDCDVEIVIPPKGIVEIVVGLVVALAASYVLAPSVPTLQSGEAATDSPNNSLAGQTNIIRLDEQEPNVYGNVVSYPDLIVAEGGAWEYANNVKIVREVFLVGIQDYAINSVPRYENTPITSISGQSYVIYEPDDIIPVIQGQFNSEFIDGQSLPGPNNDDVTDGTTADGTSSPSLSVSDDTIDKLVVTNIVKDSNWNSLFSETSDGDIPIRVRFTYSYYALNEDPSPACVPNEVIKTGLMRMTDAGATYSATFEEIDVSLSDCLDPTDGNYTQTISVTELVGGAVTVELPIYTPEVQVSFDFRAGLRGTAEIQVVIGGDGGNDIENIYTYSANTSSQQFRTEMIDTSSFTGNLVVTVLRANEDKEDGSDAAQLSQVATNSYRNSVVYGDRTVLTTERRATLNAISLRDSKINVDVTRKTVTYDSGTGQVIETTSPSRSFADAILHEYYIVNGLDYNELPLDDMYEISDRIGELGNFDYTFSDKEQDLNQKLKIIANVARCVINFDGSKWSIYRNEPGLPAAQFDSRNIASDSPEEVSFRGFQAASNDGVKLKWRDPTDNTVAYVYYVVQGASSVRCVYNNDGTYTPSLPKFPIEIDLTGCYTESQAVDRADLECRTLIYIQETLQTKTLVDGENVSKGQIVKHADYWFEDIASGEISEINGNVYTSYSDIDLPLGNYYVTYTNTLGEPSSPIPCELISSTQFAATLPDAYIANGFSIQGGSRFIISSLDEQNNTLYRVNDKILGNDATVTLELIEYDERIYPEND